MKTEPRIYLSPPHMGGEELTLVSEAFESNWIAPAGPHLNAFEQEFAELVGAEHAVAVSSGTAALHLALRYAGVERGDEVFCSSLTFIASATPILFLGATPVFIDSGPETWNMDPDLLEQALADRAAKNRLPRAVVVVHLYGQCADMDRIVASCNKYNVTLVEDAAEALGATYKSKSPGTFGQSGIFSFNGNKIITTSSGGMLVTNDRQLAEKVRFWATQAKENVPHYEHLEMGYNYRMSNILAAIGRGQLRVLADRVQAKQRIFDNYRLTLGELPGVSFMPESTGGRSTRWLTCMLIDEKMFGCGPETLCRTLEQQNIEARPLWKPLHMQPLFADCEMVGGRVAEQLFARGICLPSGTAMTDDEFSRVVKVICSTCPAIR